MKTHTNKNDHYSTVGLPEMITWIIGLLFFAGMLLSLNLIGQEEEKYTKDTLWLKTGEVIPCLVVGSTNLSRTVVVKKIDQEGKLVFDQYSLKQVARMKKGQSDSNEKSETHLPDVPKSPKIYIAFGGGFPGTAGVSLNFLAKNDMGGSISYKFRSIRSNNEPSDYRGIMSMGTPGDEVIVLSACFVKAFPSKTTRLVRFAVEGGPAWINYSEAHFSPSSSWFGNYRVNYTTKNTAGLTLRAKLELPLSQVVGFELALAGNINPVRSFAGLEIYLTLGRVRDRKNPRK